MLSFNNNNNNTHNITVNNFYFNIKYMVDKFSKNNVSFNNNCNNI